jgi:hypothetical protein
MAQRAEVKAKVEAKFRKQKTKVRRQKDRRQK